MRDWIDGNAMAQIEVDESRILRLSSAVQILRFSAEFTDRVETNSSRTIRWGAVADRWDGIEIAPYSWSMRLHDACGWYYGWDVASGCVWHPRSVRLVSTQPIRSKPCAR